MSFVANQAGLCERKEAGSVGALDPPYAAREYRHMIHTIVEDAARIKHALLGGDA